MIFCTEFVCVSYTVYMYLELKRASRTFMWHIHVHVHVHVHFFVMYVRCISFGNNTIILNIVIQLRHWETFSSYRNIGKLQISWFMYTLYSVYMYIVDEKDWFTMYIAQTYIHVHVRTFAHLYICTTVRVKMKKSHARDPHVGGVVLCTWRCISWGYYKGCGKFNGSHVRDHPDARMYTCTRVQHRGVSSTKLQ